MIRIDFLCAKIDEHAKKAENAYELYRENDDELHFNNLCMECFQASNYLIDFCQLTVKELALGFPESYKEFVESLLQHDAISKEEAELLLRVISLRNKIAHEYHIIHKGSLIELYLAIRESPQIKNKLMKRLLKK